MITFKELITEQDFESLKTGDFVACEFHRNIHDYPKTYRFNVFKIHSVKKESKEVILQKKNNIYFNYGMFEHKSSIVKKAILISHYQETND